MAERAKLIANFRLGHLCLAKRRQFIPLKRRLDPAPLHAIRNPYFKILKSLIETCILFCAVAEKIDRLLALEITKAQKSLNAQCLVQRLLGEQFAAQQYLTDFNGAVSIGCKCLFKLGAQTDAGV